MNLYTAYKKSRGEVFIMRLPKELNELKNVSCWAAYRLFNYNPIPIDPETGNEMIINNDAHLLTYDEIIKIIEKYKLDGAGLLLPSGYGCIKLENVCMCFDMMQAADSVIKVMNSYTEWTHLRDGIIILYKAPNAKNLCLTSVDEKCILNKLCPSKANNFIAITGNIYGNPLTINERNDELQCVHDCFYLLDFMKLNDGIYRTVYHDIAKIFLNECTLKQVYINFDDENGVTLKAPFLSSKELNELEVLLTSPKIHAAIILRLAMKDQRVGSIINTLDYYALRLWERGMANALLTGMALFNNIGHAVRMMYFSASDYVIPSEVQQGIFMMDGCFYLAAAVFLLSVVWISSKVNYVQAFFVAMPYI